MIKFEIQVPGKFRSGVAFLDLETVKVPTPDGYRMPSGEALKNRWSIALAGVAKNGMITIIDLEGDEQGGLDELSYELKSCDAVIYSATREFDEMICRGRFTNARRAHLPVPTFPAVPGAERFVWQNVRPTKDAVAPERDEDIPSREVPAGLKDGRRNEILVHLLRDVAELILLGGAQNAECWRWCSKILVDYYFALSQIA